MVCQTCGTQLPDGTPSCPTCGAQLYAQPQQPYMDPNQMFNQTPVAPVKKNNTGMIIGIVAAVIAVIAIVFVVINYVKNNKDGVYYLTEMTMDGDTYTIEDMEEMVGTEVVVTMEVKGKSCVIDGEALDFNNETYNIEFDGNNFRLTSIYEDVSGKYDPDDKTLTISDPEYGMSMTFKLKD